MDEAAKNATVPPSGARKSSSHRSRLGQILVAARTPRGIVGLTLAGFVVLLAVIGPLVAPGSDTATVTVPFAPPSTDYLLGSDNLGRDVLSRLLHGGWALLLMAVAATVIGIALGAAAGISAGYLGGKRDSLIMRSADVILAFPSVVLALLLVSVIGPKVWLIVLAVGVSHAPQVARVLRSATLDVAERDFVKAAPLDGASSAAVMGREILPNLVSPLMVEAGLRLTYSIIIIAGLSFLGFGLAPPSPNWGQMINENRVGIQANPWATLSPVTVIALLTIGVNMFTDAVARVAIGVDRQVLTAAEDDPAGSVA